MQYPKNKSVNMKRDIIIDAITMLLSGFINKTVVK